MNLLCILALPGMITALALPQGTLPPASASTPKAVPSGLSSLLNALPAFSAAADWTNNVADDLVNGTACKDIVYIIARGSGEPGNIGLCTNLLSFGRSISFADNSWA
jgi:hypothetical protein